MTENRTKYTLITNLAFVQRQKDNLRLHCHALLLSEQQDGMLGPQWTLRGFGTEGAWEIFDMWLDKEQFPFTLTATHDPSKIVFSHDGTEKPLFSGSLLTFTDGLSFFLQADQDDQPIDVHAQEGDVLAIWDLLERKTAKYWNAPYMPRLQYAPVELRRRMAGVE